MYKSLTDLDLTPSQRKTLEFLIKQAGRYEVVRLLAGINAYTILDELNYPFEFDRKIDDINQDSEAK